AERACARGTTRPSATTKSTTIHAYLRNPHAHVEITSLVLSISPSRANALSLGSGLLAYGEAPHARAETALPGRGHMREVDGEGQRVARRPDRVGSGPSQRGCPVAHR